MCVGRQTRKAYHIPKDCRFLAEKTPDRWLLVLPGAVHADDIDTGADKPTLVDQRPPVLVWQAFWCGLPLSLRHGGNFSESASELLR
jgi:hypothetical protein